MMKLLTTILVDFKNSHLSKNNKESTIYLNIQKIQRMF